MKKIFYAGFADNLQSKKANMSRAWQEYPATKEGYKQAVIDGYTATSNFEFSHAVNEKIQPIRYGDLILDFDAKKQVISDTGELMYVGDIKKSLDAVVMFSKILEELYEVDIYEELFYFASGGKGFHVVIPASVIGSTGGDIELPSIYNQLINTVINHKHINKIKTNAIDVALMDNEQDRFANFCIDTNGFKGGKGQLIRLPHIQRGDGKYKVPVPTEEIVTNNAEYFEKLVLQDRRIESLEYRYNNRENLKPVTKLFEIYTKIKDKQASKKIKENKVIATEAIVNNCEFIEFCKNNSEQVDEPHWFALARILAFMGFAGEELFHAWSKLDRDRYQFDNCQSKIIHARGYSPITCAEIREKGFCHKNCKVRTPIELHQKVHASKYFAGIYIHEPHGLYYCPEPDDLTKAYFVSSYIKVIALARDPDNKSWGKHIELKDPDANLKTCIIPTASFVGSCESALIDLLDLGLDYKGMKENKERLVQYLRSSNPKERVLTINKNGWTDETYKYFIPFDLGAADNEDYIFSSNTNIKNSFREKGLLSEWQEQIGKLCMNNALLQISVMTALAGPFLPITQHQGFGIHFYGNSSTGKSTCLKIAHSVTGGNMGSWRTTSNGLEGIAEQHNHNCLILDEINSCKPEEVDSIAYMLANGQGKARSTKDGSAKDIKLWNLVFVSSGELAITARIKQGFTKTAMAGQEVRCISLLADGGTSQGIFTQVPKNMQAASFADNFIKQANLYCGTPLRAVVQHLKARKNSILSEINEIRKGFLSGIADTLSSQANRVADHFAFLAGVGELCIDFEILPWKKGEAFDAADFCLSQWLDHNGASENFEIKSIADKIIDLVINDFYGKVNSFEGDTKSTIYKEEKEGKVCYFIPKQYLIMQNICQKHQYDDLCWYMLKKNYLELNRNGKMKNQIWQGCNTDRPYGFIVIKDNILLEDISQEHAILDSKDDYTNINSCKLFDDEF